MTITSLKSLPLVAILPRFSSYRKQLGVLRLELLERVRGTTNRVHANTLRLLLPRCCCSQSCLTWSLAPLVAAGIDPTNSDWLSLGCYQN